MRVPASSSSPLSSKTCALLEHPFQQSLAPQIQELCLPLTKTGVQEKMQKKKRSIVVRSCFTQKCFVFLIWQWCNGDRWQSWQLTCWKVSRNGKMKSAIELFFNFFSLSKWRKHFFFFFFVLIQKDEPKDQNAKMIKILSGEMAIELHLQFLIRNNNTDLMILKNTKVK